MNKRRKGRSLEIWLPLTCFPVTASYLDFVSWWWWIESLSLIISSCHKKIKSLKVRARQALHALCCWILVFYHIMKWLCSASRHCTNEGKFLIIPYNWNCHISKLWHFVEIFCVVVKWTGQPSHFTFITLFSMMNVHHSMFWINLLRTFIYPAIIYNLDIFESTLFSNTLTQKKISQQNRSTIRFTEFFMNHSQTIFKFYEILLKANTYRWIWG